MPRVLICTVGGEPQPIVRAVRENAPLELVVFLCSAGRPRSSSALTIRRSTTRQFHGHCPHCGRDYVTSVKVRPLAPAAGLEERQFVVEEIEDPDDLSQVLEACDRIAARIGALWPRREVRVLANYTGGTKTMSLGARRRLLRAGLRSQATGSWHGGDGPKSSAEGGGFRGGGLFALSRAGAGWVLQVNRVVAGGRSDLIRVRAGDHPVLQDPSKLLAEVAADRASALLACHDHQGAGLVLVSRP